MKKELLNFVRSNVLSPFDRNKTPIKSANDSLYKTKDAKSVHTKLISTLSSNFNFANTSNLFNFFEFTTDIEEIRKRQEFFSQIKEKTDNSFLKNIKVPKRWWNPKYGIVAVTEDDKTFNELQKTGCPVKFLITQSDLDSLDDYDIVQVIDCENFSRALENLPQAIFLDSIDEVYLERFVQLLSAWKENLETLKNNKTNEDISNLVEEIYSLTDLLEEKPSEFIKKETIEESLRGINNEISSELKNLTISGESLFTMMSNSTLPQDFLKIIKLAIENSKMPVNLYTRTIPVEIDEKEMQNLLRKQDITEHTNIAEKIKKRADKLRKLPTAFQDLSDRLLLFDFMSGISNFIASSTAIPKESSEFVLEESSNLFLDKAQPISFHLNDQNKCSILTGANSGGKTTLLEHIIQLNSLFQLGLPTQGNFETPLFTEVYYFAKNKGSLNKGAFETLLVQMSKIKPGKRTLILADEIESVTEPGVAGAIVCATADFFIKQGCFLVIATHLGKEIQKNIPALARIDGIEAKGLDENYELIVDHNPVLGRLANSTPELIIEKMANSYKTDYFDHLYNSIRRDK